MFPSKPAPAVPPEVLAIAVALAAQWQAAQWEAAQWQAAQWEAASSVRPADPPSRWKWSGRTWERPASHRWS